MGGCGKKGYKWCSISLLHPYDSDTTYDMEPTATGSAYQPPRPIVDILCTLEAVVSDSFVLNIKTVCELLVFYSPNILCFLLLHHQGIHTCTLTCAETSVRVKSKYNTLFARRVWQLHAYFFIPLLQRFTPEMKAAADACGQMPSPDNWGLGMVKQELDHRYAHLQCFFCFYT